MANFKESNRYTNGLITKNRSGKDFLILRRPLKLQESDGDVFIELTQEYEFRPDLIAHKAYGNSDLWWVICEVNQVYDPFFQLKMGMILRIPELSRVLAAIEALGT